MPKAYTHEQMIAAFWAKVVKRTPDRCWEWMGARVPAGGYGRFLYKKKLIAAHRVAYLLTYGELPAGMDIMHICDNPPCCNPDHLQAATTLENMRDAMHKGRHVHGERQPRSKLTAANVLEIRSLRGKEAGTSIAARFGVNASHISNIWARRLWKHLP